MLDYKRMTQDVGKDDSPSLHPHTFRSLVELDVATQKVIQKDKNGLSDTLRQLSFKDDKDEEHY